MIFGCISSMHIPTVKQTRNMIPKRILFTPREKNTTAIHLLKIHSRNWQSWQKRHISMLRHKKYTQEKYMTAKRAVQAKMLPWPMSLTITRMRARIRNMTVLSPLIIKVWRMQRTILLSLLLMFTPTMTLQEMSIQRTLQSEWLKFSSLAMNSTLQFLQ